jgi:aminoglycoside 6'-N-acetyltransferase I
VTIRAAAAADHAVWARLLSRLHAGTAEAELRDEVGRLAALDDPYVGFLAFAGDTPVGLIDARVRNYAEGAPDLRAAYVEDLWVEPGFRRAGVARALLAAVEDWARGQGLRWLGSDTEPGNRASRGWHAAAGFREIEQLVVFGKPLDA